MKINSKNLFLLFIIIFASMPTWAMEKEIVAPGDDKNSSKDVPTIPDTGPAPKNILPPPSGRGMPLGVRIRGPRSHNYNINGTNITLIFSHLSTLAESSHNVDLELFIGYTDFDRLRIAYDAEMARLNLLIRDRNVTTSNLNNALEKKQSSLKTVGRLFGATMFASFGAALYTVISKNPNAVFNWVGFNTKHSAPVITVAFFTSGVVSGLIGYHCGLFNFEK